MNQNIDKSIAPKVVGSKVLSIPTISWEDKLERCLDVMVSSFLTFPKKYPEDYRDRQFARHLLWRIGDERGNIIIPLMKGAGPHNFDRFWIRLMPYIDGRFPEKIPKVDVRLFVLSAKLYEIMKDLIMNDNGSFEELMDRVVRAIREVRAI